MLFLSFGSCANRVIFFVITKPCHLFFHAPWFRIKRGGSSCYSIIIYLKDRLLALHAGALAAADALLAFAARHQAILWPGYTHQRRAMPSSVGLWAAGYAE